MMIYLVFEICFSLDLRSTIINPLYPSEKRMRDYVAAVVITLVYFYIAEYLLIEGSIFKGY